MHIRKKQNPSVGSKAYKAPRDENGDLVHLKPSSVIQAGSPKMEEIQYRVWGAHTAPVGGSSSGEVIPHGIGGQNVQIVDTMFKDDSMLYIRPTYAKLVDDEYIECAADADPAFSAPLTGDQIRLNTW